MYDISSVARKSFVNCPVRYPCHVMGVESVVLHLIFVGTCKCMEVRIISQTGPYRGNSWFVLIRLREYRVA